MTQEEEMWVYKHLSPEDFETYQQGQARFYEQVLALWQIPQEKCTPKELGNLILSVILIYNSAARSLPFFFTEELERTAQAQATALSRYLASLADTDAYQPAAHRPNDAPFFCVTVKINHLLCRWREYLQIKANSCAKLDVGLQTTNKKAQEVQNGQ